MKLSAVFILILTLAAPVVLNAADYDLTRNFAFGIYGDLLAGSSPANGGLGLSLKWGDFPVIGLSWNLSGSGSVGGTVDYWVINQELGGTALDYYVGLGAFAGIGFGNGGAFDIGARLPLGLQFFPVKKFEVFLEGAPEVGFYPGINLLGDIRLGIRVHF